MEFEINFNRETDDKTLEIIGAEYKEYGYVCGYLSWAYKINLNSFEELETLLKKVKEIKGEEYFAIIGLDPPTIYLDKDI